MPTPTGEAEPIEVLTPSTDNVGDNGIESVTPKPKKVSSNTEIAFSEPMSYSNASVNVDSNSSNAEEYVHDSGKASLFALLGGGIMGIVATILALLL